MLIEGRGLAQRYGRRWVFRSLDITVGAGVTALLGPNGSGKTTLLHTVVGLRPSRAGTLTTLGANMLRRGGRQAVAAQLGFLPQTVGFYPGYTLQDYVAYAAWLKGVPSRQLSRKVMAALKRVDLADRARSKMRTLSGGMLQRAGIAQAIVNEPRLLVLDEPAAGLDPAQQIDFRHMVRDLAQSAAVLLSTHAVEDVKQTADTVLVLREGEMVFSGTVSDLEKAAGGNKGPAGTPVERGYLAALRRARPVVASR